MTTASYKLKISSPSLKLKTLPRYPGQINGGAGIAVSGTPSSIAIALNYLGLAPLNAFDPTAEFLAITDANGNYRLVSVATLLNNVATTVQIVTGAGDVAVGINTQLLVMNRAADQNPSNIILPLSNTKIGKLKIVDFKGNASAWPHTIKTTNTDTFQGALTQWNLNGDGASIVVDPIPGTGYAV